MLQHGQQCIPLLYVEFRYHSEEEYEMDHYDLYDVDPPTHPGLQLFRQPHQDSQPR